MSQRKYVIKQIDMASSMQKEAIKSANEALDNFKLQKDIAAYIKQCFDKNYSPSWHCIVGKDFGCYVTNQNKHFIYFYIDQLGVLLFKPG